MPRPLAPSRIVLAAAALGAGLALAAPARAETLTFTTLAQGAGAVGYSAFAVDGDGVAYGTDNFQATVFANGLAPEFSPPPPDFTGQLAHARYSEIRGVSDSYGLVGVALDDNLGRHGFLFHDGVYTEVDAGHGGVAAMGVNALGQIVGNDLDGAFIQIGSASTRLGLPGLGGNALIGLSANGINDLGDIVGGLRLRSDQSFHGYVLHDDGTLDLLDIAGATFVEANGINNQGQIVGVYKSAGSDTLHSFLYSGGQYTLFDHPGGLFGTIAWDINDAGQIAGHYNDRDAQGGARTSAFLATIATGGETAVPEPGTWALLSLGAALARARRRR